MAEGQAKSGIQRIGAVIGAECTIERAKNIAFVLAIGFTLHAFISYLITGETFYYRPLSKGLTHGKNVKRSVFSFFEEWHPNSPDAQRSLPHGWQKDSSCSSVIFLKGKLDQLVFRLHLAYTQCKRKSPRQNPIVRFLWTNMQRVKNLEMMHTPTRLIEVRWPKKKKKTSQGSSLLLTIP